MKQLVKKKPKLLQLLAIPLILIALIPCFFFLPGCSSNTPQSLLDLRERNPETATFVASYEKEHDRHHEINLTDTYVPGTIPLYLQWDIRWGYELYGDDMIALTGCGPTCLSMVLVGLTGNTNMDPLTVANFAQENGFYCEGSGSYWTLMSDGARTLGLSSEELPLDAATVRSRLQQSQAIICVVGPGDFTTEGHFIVLTGINEKDQVSINDPNSKIKSQRLWNLQQILGQTQNLWAFSAI